MYHPPFWEKISHEGYTSASIPLSRDAQATVFFTVRRRVTKFDFDGVFHGYDYNMKSMKSQVYYIAKEQTEVCSFAVLEECEIKQKQGSKG